MDPIAGSGIRSTTAAFLAVEVSLIAPNLFLFVTGAFCFEVHHPNADLKRIRLSVGNSAAAAGAVASNEAELNALNNA